LQEKETFRGTDREKITTNEEEADKKMQRRLEEENDRQKSCLQRIEEETVREKAEAGMKDEYRGKKGDEGGARKKGTDNQTNSERFQKELSY
jgi:hypothetical protein